MKKPKDRRVRKKCAKCGIVGRYYPRERRCKARVFGPKSYCCWGVLDVVQRKPRRTLRETLQALADDGDVDAAVTLRGREHRERTERQLAQVRRRVEKIDRQIKRLRTRRTKWSALVRRLTKVAAMTDVDVQVVQLRKVRKRLRNAVRSETAGPAAPV